ncbi:MAG: hypothetical protein MUF27_13035 [Acidobacteria bacterium]|jgi:hypothetical protein|nr:hypothetical protein [Acidobacteriota bacterium]
MHFPPAIVVGAELNGLGVARPLAKAGIPVWAVASGSGAQAPLLLTKDEPVLWVSRHREALTAHFLVNLPDDETVRLLMNKRQFLERAQREGWPMPRTVLAGSLEELEQRAPEIPFPCILKPQLKNERFRGLGALEVKLRPDGTRSRRSGALYRRRGLLSVDQLRALRAGTRRDMLWRADDPGPGLAALCQAAAAALARPVRRALRSVQ